MKKIVVQFLLTVLWMPSLFAQANENEYIAKYKDVAISEMERAGVPASIKLGQAILESSAGTSLVALEANNHFGTKCGGDWKGKTFEKQEEERDENGKAIKSCFRKYNTVEESYFDQSEFLRDPRKYYRYGFLFGLDKQDYKAWARGLESAGYAPVAGYAEKLIGVIERYKLFQYDNAALQNAASGGKDDTKGRITRVNDAKVVLTRNGETLEDIARMFRIKTDKVIDYNDNGYAAGQKLPTGTRIFLQKKRSKWRGKAEHHFVRDFQTMFDISQLYGVQSH
jgi:Mannosyl-glycoprotein endo-beta-N-acetylglucosaminidase